MGVDEMTSRPIDNRPSPATTLTRTGVTGPGRGHTLSHVSKSWPVDEFNTYLRALMNAVGIESHAELSRLTGVSQNQFSNWRRGLAQPSRENLRKIAPALGLRSPVTLYLAAGLESQEHLELDATPDFRVLPKPFQDLREVYEELKLAGQEDMVLSSIRVLVDGLKAQVREVQAGQPSGRRRRAS